MKFPEKWMKQEINKGKVLTFIKISLTVYCLSFQKNLPTLTFEFSL